jgi:hypothetical protein
MITLLNKALIGAGLSLCVVACATQRLAPTVAAASEPQAGCVETGSRIGSECAAIGRAYDQQEIRTAGATDAHQALRMLDSSVTLPGR